jgi:phospholipid transport system transporter-binding protein
MIRLQRISDQQARLSGDLLADTIMQVLAEGNELIAHASGEWELDMGSVEKVSSVGVALLLDWMRSAQKAGVALKIRQLPEHLLPIIRVSDLDDLFAEVRVPD